MKINYYTSILFCCALIFFGCSEDPKNETNIYFGGQINNPETDYVVLSKEKKVIDTLYLNNNNQFGKNFKNLEGGIYTFKHPPESQIMYVEPGDSIVIWLNTLSFDESLNFSGEGSEKSSFLLDIFIKNQKNNDFVIDMFNIKPSRFATMTDSIRDLRLAELQELKEKKDLSKEFLEIAESNINYEYYDLRERYTYIHRKYKMNAASELPADFNDYRKDINFSNREMQDYYVYTNLIDNYLKTRAVEHCEEHHDDQRSCYDLNAFENISRRMIMIDSLSTITSLKNKFLDRFSEQAIAVAEKQSRIDSILQLLETINYSNLDDARKLAQMQKNYFIGRSINDLKIKNTDGELITYAQVINNPTITYAWSIYAPAHHKWQHDNIAELKRKFPEIQFIGVNIDLGEREEWLRTIETYGYDKSAEFQISRSMANKEIYMKFLNKVLFVSDQGVIMKGDVQLGNPNLESQILEFLNK